MTTTTRPLVDGPAVPSETSHAVHRPVSAQITGGQLGHWQRVNRDASIPLGIAKLEEAGNYDNLRMAAGQEMQRDYQGPVYMDSDVHKMIETAAFELGRASGAQHEDDQDLRAFVATATELLEAAQEADGYLNSHHQVKTPGVRYTALENSHELYTAGHLLQAAVALARAGDDQLLPTARRLADHLVQVFLRDGFQRLDGHPEAETALVELFRLTGEHDYLALAELLVDGRGHGRVGYSPVGSAYFQDAIPVREMPNLTGHAVRAMYLEAGIIDVYLENGDRALLDASVARWEDMVAARTALTGGHGSRQLKEAFGEAYELPSDQSYNETCAAVASIHWSWRLLLATGEARYADLIERTLYNVFAASVSLDGLEFFKGNPLQRRADHARAIGDPRFRDGWFWSACCPPNVTRLMSSLQHYLATATEDTLYLQQYAAGTVAGQLSAGNVELTVDTDYPWDGRVAITVGAGPVEPWTLALRVPSWSKINDLTVNGEPITATAGAPGYPELNRAWQQGDMVELTLDLTPRVTTPDPRIDAVRGCVAIERGPLVYCWEQIDQDADVDLEAVQLDGDAVEEIAVDDHPGIGRTILLRLPAVELTLPAPALPYGPERSYESRPVTVTALPYFQWANRDRRAMRVWLPRSSAARSSEAQSR